MQQEMEELELRRRLDGQGLGNGKGNGNGQGPAIVNIIETEDVNMLSSALEDMDYEDVLQWEGPDPKQADKRKRAVSDGEAVEYQ